MLNYYLQHSHLKGASAVFGISGPDANTFLQGQFTQELRISPGQFAYGLWLNQKGKVLGDSYVLRVSDEEHLVFAPRWEPAEFRQRLDDYLIADEVTLADESSSWIAILLWGSDAGVALRSLGFAPLDSGAANSWRRRGAAFAWVARHATTESFWVLVRAEEHAAISRELSAKGAHEASREIAESVRIAAGVPAVPDDIGASDLPNEGGLDEVGISYTKGCYLGQEVMSRLKNLGQVRRRLFVVRGTGKLPASRAPLFQGEQRVGELRSVALHGEGFVAFAMLSLMQLDRGRRLSLSPAGSENISVTENG
jgi:tRNA-modifying protein YgfZ